MEATTSKPWQHSNELLGQELLLARCSGIVSSAGGSEQESSAIAHFAPSARPLLDLWQEGLPGEGLLHQPSLSGPRLPGLVPVLLRGRSRT